MKTSDPNALGRYVLFAFAALVLTVSVVNLGKVYAQEALNAQLEVGFTAPTEREDGTPIGEIDFYTLACAGPEDFERTITAAGEQFERALPEGVYECTMTATDGYGLTSQASQPASFTVAGVDLAPPQAPEGLTINVSVTVTITSN